MTQPVLLKRAYDEPAKSDGFRVLVDRLWPRGVSKVTLRLDMWAKDVAPRGKTSTRVMSRHFASWKRGSMPDASSAYSVDTVRPLVPAQALRPPSAPMNCAET